MMIDKGMYKFNVYLIFDDKQSVKYKKQSSVFHEVNVLNE